MLPRLQHGRDCAEHQTVLVGQRHRTLQQAQRFVALERPLQVAIGDQPVMDLPCLSGLELHQSRPLAAPACTHIRAAPGDP